MYLEIFEVERPAFYTELILAPNSRNDKAKVNKVRLKDDCVYMVPVRYGSVKTQRDLLRLVKRVAKLLGKPVPKYDVKSGTFSYVDKLSGIKRCDTVLWFKDNGELAGYDGWWIMEQLVAKRTLVASMHMHRSKELDEIYNDD